MQWTRPTPLGDGDDDGDGDVAEEELYLPPAVRLASLFCFSLSPRGDPDQQSPTSHFHTARGAAGAKVCVLQQQ